MLADQGPFNFVSNHFQFIHEWSFGCHHILHVFFIWAFLALRLFPVIPLGLSELRTG
jgi:hypothetical protein